MTRKRTFVAATDKGLVRQNNEDAYILLNASDQQTYVLILADGMGGHKKGEVASSIAVHYVAEAMEQWLRPDRSDQEILDQLTELQERTNAKVYLESMIAPESRGMGTTLTLAVIIRDQLFVGHVGDCRGYILRKNTLFQITTDHTLVQALIDSGELSRHEAAQHPQRNVLTKALGVPEYIDADLIQMPIVAGDRLVLSSDGLHGYVPEDEIREIMIRARNPEIMTRSLINLANRCGGKDNVTVIGGFL